jgi:hypothetical protein
MHIKARSSVRLLMLFIIAVMAAFILLANRQERASSLPHQKTGQARQKAEIDKFLHNKATLPQVDYTSAESKIEIQSEFRKARSKRHNAGGVPLANMRENITEITREEDSFVPLPALPIQESDVVVVGTVTDAKGYLSEDKSGAYSEYSVNVSEVLKGAAKLSSSQIIAERFGAKVVLPNGRTILVWNTNNGTPETKHRYVLFLKYNPEGDDYLIITGYELINNRVKALDRPETFAIFEGNEETAFLDLVRSSVK